MALKTYKPYTKSTRATVLLERGNLWKGSSYKPLTKGQKSTGGRNNYGRITSRHKGAGVKHKYRIIDFLRKKKDIAAIVERIEYDPNRTAFIALIKYEDNERSYILCPQGIKVGDKVFSGKKADIKVGNNLELKDIPPGTTIHNVELIPGNGGKLARSAGSSVTFLHNDGAIIPGRVRPPIHSFVVGIIILPTLFAFPVTRLPMFCSPLFFSFVLRLLK